LHAGLRVRELPALPHALLRPRARLLAVPGRSRRSPVRDLRAALRLSPGEAEAALADRLARLPSVDPVALRSHYRLCLVDTVLAHRRHHQCARRHGRDERTRGAVAELLGAAHRLGLSRLSLYGARALPGIGAAGPDADGGGADARLLALRRLLPRAGAD